MTRFQEPGLPWTLHWTKSWVTPSRETSPIFSFPLCLQSTYSSTSSLVRLVKRRPTSPLNFLLTCKTRGGGRPSRGSSGSQLGTTRLPPPPNIWQHLESTVGGRSSSLGLETKGELSLTPAPGPWLERVSCESGEGSQGDSGDPPDAGCLCTRQTGSDPVPPSSPCFCQRTSYREKEGSVEEAPRCHGSANQLQAPGLELWPRRRRGQRLLSMQPRALTFFPAQT